MTAWNHDFIQQLSSLPMGQLDLHFGLSTMPTWPNAMGLNALKNSLPIANSSIPEFVCQSDIAESALYYEQVIQQHNIIPTRPNSWHDLFNGLIWLQFPQTKRLLNQQHVEDIQQFGLSPRTHRRNNLTHFDECGVIITYRSEDTFAKLIAGLQQHQWHKVLVENRQYWGNELNCFMFGHANLEMLLQPFIGLTGKFLALEVDSHFATMPYAEQLTLLDKILFDSIQSRDLFSINKPLSPLPLLGIPNVCSANQDPAFYANTDYFRPKPLSKLLLK
ncbi:DUF3025 domain-containing protein [uncultured Paraglaciecola sp.]|uniref:DUF3025 domain-containing protein n=1 Tax=uncultured Paraglaciecola sp. TaxID=1765024 RepID=UPI00261D9C17|nr:DUF3025 domain-containing protein [uncultured Paraglaciecola sp.]